MKIMVTAANSRPPVFVQGDTVVFFADPETRLICNTADLSVKRNNRCRYISVTDLHDPDKGPGEVTRMLGLHDDLLQMEWARLKRQYPFDRNASRAAAQARKEFYEVYDELPPSIRAIAESMGIDVILARPRHTLDAVSGERGDRAYNALQDEQHLYFTAARSTHYGTVAEEVSHAVDRFIGRHAQAECYTKSHPWKKAVALDLKPSNKKGKFILDVYDQRVSKSNIASALYATIAEIRISS
jgi:hypothetical protein